MAEVTALPGHGTVLPDRRDAGRSVRVAWHGDVVVVSIWRDDRCVATAQIEAADVPQAVAALVQGLADGVTAPPARRPA